MALLLKSHGVTRVRPLSGGLEGWRSRDFPMESVLLAPPADPSSSPLISLVDRTGQ